MASQATAEKARRQHAERLRRLGAHAIEVAAVRRSGRRTFVVVAHFAEAPSRNIPHQLPVIVGTKTVNVELVIKISAPFRPDRFRPE